MRMHPSVSQSKPQPKSPVGPTVSEEVKRWSVGRVGAGTAAQNAPSAPGPPPGDGGHALAAIPTFRSVRVSSVGARPRLQPKLEVGASNDLYEREADSIAEQVLSTPEPRIQRACACGGTCPDCKKKAQRASSSPERIQRRTEGGWRDVPRAEGVKEDFQQRLGRESTTGRPLDTETRGFFEPRFGTSFAGVRVHDGPQAADLAQQVRARAFTVGQNIYFGKGQHDARSRSGRQLLAHELTHTLQQRSTTMPSTGAGKISYGADRGLSPPSPTPGARIQRWEDFEDGDQLASYTDEEGARHHKERFEAANPDLEFRIVPHGGNFVIQSRPATSGSGSGSGQPPICGRASTKVPGFPDPHISRVTIDLGDLTSGLSISWSRDTAETRALPSSFPISPGAGLCTLCCNDRRTSRTSGSLCTPKGQFHVDRYQCALSTSWAENATFFAAGIRSGITIHKGPRAGWPPRPGYPASHGCVRTSEEGSKIVYDNSKTSTTEVHVGGTWNGSHCYNNINERSAHRRSGSEVCNSSVQNDDAPKDSGAEDSAPRVAALGPGGDPPDGAGPA